MPGSKSRPNVSEGYEVPLSYGGDRSFYRQHVPRKVMSWGKTFKNYNKLEDMCTLLIIFSRLLVPTRPKDQDRSCGVRQVRVVNAVNYPVPLSSYRPCSSSPQGSKLVLNHNDIILAVTYRSVRSSSVYRRPLDGMHARSLQRCATTLCTGRRGLVFLPSKTYSFRQHVMPGTTYL